MIWLILLQEATMLAFHKMILLETPLQNIETQLALLIRLTHLNLIRRIISLKN